MSNPHKDYYDTISESEDVVDIFFAQLVYVRTLLSDAITRLDAEAGLTEAGELASSAALSSIEALYAAERDYYEKIKDLPDLPR